MHRASRVVVIVARRCWTLRWDLCAATDFGKRTGAEQQKEAGASRRDGDRTEQNQKAAAAAHDSIDTNRANGFLFDAPGSVRPWFTC